VSADRYRGFSFDEAALAEDVDLDAGRRRDILFAEGRAATATHWEVLDIPWNASGDQARAAYLEKVKVFHPDRYPGKRLGSFRARLERAFRRLTEAREALSDEARRVAYARATAPPEEFARLEARKLEDERRSAERRARLARQNPLVGRAQRIAELVSRGKEALAADRLSQAAADLQIALSLDPVNAEVKALAAEARKRAGAAKAGELYDRGLQADMGGNAAGALAAYRLALEADPGHARAAARGALSALQLADLASARELAQAALRAGPSLAAAHEAAGAVALAEGDKAEARRLLERAVELDPKLDTAKERLKKLRWGFFR
jgi:curved DNA-binding protein CbpA